jgi:phage/plasmid-associated DNA primase
MKYDSLSLADKFCELYPKKYLYMVGFGWLAQSPDKTHYMPVGNELAIRSDVYKALRIIEHEFRQSIPDGKMDAEHKRTLKRLSVYNSRATDIIKCLQVTLRRNSARFGAEDVLNCKNGLVDLNTGDLVPRTDRRIFTSVIDVKYNPSITDKSREYREWVKFIANCVQGGLRTAEFLQKCAGYSITSSNKEEVFFYLQGTYNGRNGKGTFLETLLYLLGHRGQIQGDLQDGFAPFGIANRVDVSTFENGHAGGAPRPDLVCLKDSRFVHVPEIAEHVKLSSTQLKNLTGTTLTPISARTLHAKDYIYFIPKFKLWLDSNFPVNASASDEAFYKRVVLIKWPYHHTDKPVGDMERKIDVDFKAKFTRPAYLEAILKWLVDGAVKWHREGLGRLGDMQSALHASKNEADTLFQFMEQHGYIVHEALARNNYAVPSFYTRYRDWVKDNFDFKPIHPRTVAARLRSRGGDVSNKAIRFGSITARAFFGVIQVDAERPVATMQNAWINGKNMSGGKINLQHLKLPDM